MSKPLLTLAVLLLTAGPVAAEVYRCTDRAGQVLFTDAPLPDSGCRPIELPPLPATTAAAPPAAVTISPAPTPAAEPAAAAAQEESVDWKSRVDSLVAQYQAAHHQALFGKLVNDKIKARRELKTIRAERDKLRQELDQAPVSRQEREALLGALEAIVDSQ